MADGPGIAPGVVGPRWSPLRNAAICPILPEAANERSEGVGSTMKPSVSLANNREQVREVLQRFGMTNPRIFGSVARNEDNDASDLDILIDARTGTSLHHMAAAEVVLEAILGCRVQVLTRGFLAPDVAERAQTDLLPIP